ncbi:hypothetical protein OUZ56_021975 [Daphnia magna]|uniref:Uncharacterized protein n=1 Tax=Daphnia magna TaxID=35525 RepID=A0ABR0AUZ7_9CRUS|nr:hypothetical protein OUZ56_021975 [Daphnia magna]
MSTRCVTMTTATQGRLHLHGDGSKCSGKENQYDTAKKTEENEEDDSPEGAVCMQPRIQHKSFAFPSKAT